MILSNKRITKALISLGGCAGWSAPLLFVNPRRQGFPRRGPLLFANFCCRLLTFFKITFPLRILSGVLPDLCDYAEGIQVD